MRCAVQDWAALRCQLIFVFDSPLPGGGTDGRYERHNELSAWLVRKGRVWLEADGKAVTAGAGQWVICTGRHIRQKLSPDVHLLSVRVHHDWPDGSNLFAGGPLEVFAADGHEKLESLALELVRDFGPIKWGNLDRSFAFLRGTRIDYSTYLRQQIHLLAWLDALAQILLTEGWRMDVPAGVDGALSLALHVIDSHNPGEPFPASTVTEAAGLTLGHLNRLCQASLGLTLRAYWDHRRIEWARSALRQESAHIKTIASALGFTQLSHFSVWCKRHLGAAPRNIRRKSDLPASAAIPTETGSAPDRPGRRTDRSDPRGSGRPRAGRRKA